MKRALAVLLLAACGLLQAQPYPSKPIKIVVPFPAGGIADLYARLIGARLSDRWAQPVLVENRTGAGGNIGADVVAKAVPDGYTLLLTSGAIVTASQHMYKSMPFDPEIGRAHV